MSDSATDRLAAAFLDRSLPKEEFTHAAHLRVGLWHLLRYPQPEALDRLRAGIRGYNVAVGGENTLTAGYHETITRFYVWAIARFLADAGTAPVDDLADAVVIACGDRQLPFRYWSRDNLMSAAARIGWVEPDLRPLEEEAQAALEGGRGGSGPRAYPQSPATFPRDSPARP